MEPFGKLGIELTQSELRKTAYEILIGAYRSSSAGRPLTYNSSASTKERLQRQNTGTSLRLSARSKVKKALGLSRSKKNDDSEAKRGGGNVNVSELIRVQMVVSEATD